jgi:hypothetical protein
MVTQLGRVRPSLRRRGRTRRVWRSVQSAVRWRTADSSALCRVSSGQLCSFFTPSPRIRASTSSRSRGRNQLARSSSRVGADVNADADDKSQQPKGFLEIRRSRRSRRRLRWSSAQSARWSTIATGCIPRPRPCRLSSAIIAIEAAIGQRRVRDRRRSRATPHGVGSRPRACREKTPTVNSCRWWAVLARIVRDIAGSRR